MIPDAPKDLQANKSHRAVLWSWADTLPRQKQIIERCREDIVWYIDSAVYQYNPKVIDGEVSPFITWPSQEKALRATVARLFVDQDDMLWEKSRYQGATWLALMIGDWMCLFRERKKFLAVSHSEQAVDRPGDPDTLFWKVHFMHQHLPPWLLGEVRKRKLGFEYPRTHSSFYGSATTERSGVGGRATAVILDEFSKHRQDREILGQTADTGPRLFIGTHYGTGSAFYDLTQRPDLTKIVMHWSDHPDQGKGLYKFNEATRRVEYLDPKYDFGPEYPFVTDGSPSGGPRPGLRSPWYDRECSRRANARDVAMHLDINPQGSQSQFFDALMLRRCVVECACEPLWEGDLRLDPEAAQPLALVKAENGPLKLWISPTGECEVPPSKYGMGVDAATGLGASNSALCMADALTGAKVVEYATPHLRPEQFALLAACLGRLFKDANGTPTLIAWEHAGPGQMFGKTLMETGYRKVYYRDSQQLLTRTPIRTDVPGWYPNPRAKRVLLDGYNAALTNRAYVNRSELALGECVHYRYSDKRDTVEHPGDIGGSDPSGARSNHGDRVIADALCWLACQCLGAGKGGGQPDPVQQLAAVGSLEWRMELVKMREQHTVDAHPIRRHSRGIRGVLRSTR